VALGRWSWLILERSLGGGSGPQVSIAFLLAVVPATAIAAGLAATVPGIMAARTRTSATLRAP